MDMHNIVSKLVTYSTLGLVRDKSKKQKDYKRGLSPTSMSSDSNSNSNRNYNNNNNNNNNTSCWPSKQQQQLMQLQNYHKPDIINRAEVRKSGNLERISALQALRGAANSQPHYYRTGNTIYQGSHLPQLYSPDVIVRHGSISLSEDYILADGLLRTVWIS